MMGLFDRCVDPNLLVRRITVVAAHVLNEKDVPDAPEEQPDLFTDYEALEKQKGGGTGGTGQGEASAAGGSQHQKAYGGECHPQGHEFGGRRDRKGPERADRRTPEVTCDFYNNIN